MEPDVARLTARTRASHGAAAPRVPRTMRAAPRTTHFDVPQRRESLASRHAGLSAFTRTMRGSNAVPRASRISRAAPAPERMILAWYIHVPKTGGTSLYQLFQKKTRCPIAKVANATCGVRGALVNTPLQLGVVGDREWREACADAKGLCAVNSSCGVRWQLHQRDHRARHQREYQLEYAYDRRVREVCQSRGVARRSALCSRTKSYTPQHDFDAPLDPRRVSPRLAADRAARCRVFRPLDPKTSFHAGVRQKGCLPNMHWGADLNWRLAAKVRSLNLEPVVIAGVRNPFDYLVSHYLYALRATRDWEPRLDGRNGTTWGGLKAYMGPDKVGSPLRNTSSGFVCLHGLNTSLCQRAFQAHVRQRLARNDTFDARLQQHLGRPSIRLVIVPRWAWLRTEHLQHDLERVFSRVTGLPFPAGCELAKEKEARKRDPSRRCYADAYRGGATLVPKIVDADRWTFDTFGYSREPTRCEMRAVAEVNRTTAVGPVAV